MGRARRRRIIGIVPRLGRMVWAGCRWTLRHPQLLLAALGVAAVLWLSWGYVRHADVFRITYVDLPAGSSFQFPKTLIGDNLLTVDLRALAETLHRQQPSLKAVRVVRRLPNTLRVEPIQRLPVAQVWLDQWYPVDGQGFVLQEGSVEPDERLIRLVGFERAKVPLRPGRENADDRLRLALRVLGVLRGVPPSIARRLTEADVSEPDQIRFLLDGKTEVRCGSEAELADHLGRLQAALKAIAKQPFEVAYIDVRFQEPVIGPRASAMR